jgi:hypothetical protein
MEDTVQSAVVDPPGVPPNAGEVARTSSAHRDLQIGQRCKAQGVRALRVAVVAAFLFAPLSCGLASAPESVDASRLGPLPSGLDLVSAGSYPCRGSGEIGWEYTYFVVLGDDGETGGALYSHLERAGFGLRASERDDWVVTEGSDGEALIRLGPVARWRDLGGAFLEGPADSEVEEAIGEWQGPAALVGLEPSEATCET